MTKIKKYLTGLMCLCAMEGSYAVNNSVTTVIPSMYSVSAYFEPSNMEVYEELVSPLCMPEDPVVRVGFFRYPGSLEVRETWVQVRGVHNGEEHWLDVGTLVPLGQTVVAGLNTMTVSKMPVNSVTYTPNLMTGDITATAWHTSSDGITLEPMLQFYYDESNNPNISSLPDSIKPYYQDPEHAFYDEIWTKDINRRDVDLVDFLENDLSWLAQETKKTGTVTVTLNKPDSPHLGLDTRWMDLFPASGIQLPAAVYNWKNNTKANTSVQASSGEAGCLESCTASIDSDSPILSNGYRLSPENSGNAATSLIDSSNVHNLEVDHVFVDGIEIERRGAAAVTEQAMFLHSGNKVHAIDRATGCEYWTHQEPEVWLGALDQFMANKVRSTSTHLIEEPTLGKRITVVGTGYGKVMALDADNGDVVWETTLGDPLYSMITGGFQYHDGKIFVPVATKEVLLSAAQADCCFTSGKLIALDAVTGNTLWTFETIQEQPQLQLNGLIGNNGGSVWSTPAMDIERNLVFIGVSTNFTKPITEFANSMVAVDMDSGEAVWSFKGDDPRVVNDVFAGACGLPYPLNDNCDGVVADYENGEYIGIVPSPRNPLETEPTVYDFDMSSALLATTSAGQDILVAPSKSGWMFGLDPATGAEIWRNQVGAGGKLGGLHWGVAADDQMVYAGVSDVDASKAVVLPELNSLEEALDYLMGKPLSLSAAVVPGGQPGIVALDLETGAQVWRYEPQKYMDVDGVPTLVDSVHSAPVSVSNDLVFAGALNGNVIALDKFTGSELWSFDSAVRTVSPGGQPGTGGTIDSIGPFAVKDNLIINSGYSTFGGVNQYQAGPGNSTFVLKLQ